MDSISLISPCENGKSRKRPIQKDKWKRNINKLARHKPTQLPDYPKCSHRGENGPYMCRTLTMQQVKKFHEILFQTPDKIKQDFLILKYCVGSKPKRNKTTHHSVTIKYNVSLEDGSLVRVCKKSFLGITTFSANRIERVVRHFNISSHTPQERRGGDRIKTKNDNCKQAIKEFIESINYVESHYCRSKSSTRMYLPCTLNFIKLYKIYSEKFPNEPVKLSYFRDYVNSNYNVAFGTPMTDVCSTCLRAKELIKKTTTTAEQRTDILVEQKVHTLKAKAFYCLLKSEEDTIQNFSFDCQKNLSLPKLPDQAAYFSQQINYFNLTVVKGNSKCKLTPNNVFSYLWAETDLPKDSNSIASAIHNLLTTCTFSENIGTVRLFADGCGGQNKNSVMMSMLGYWLAKEAPTHIKTVQIVFPIVGHSFLPPDRVFGLIEKHIKKINIIINKEEYEDIIKNYSTIRKLGEDWSIFDWKEETKKYSKPPGQWHFKFNPSKRFIFTKSNSSVKLSGEVNYQSDLCEGKFILKKNKKFDQFKPKLLPIQNKLKGDKSTIDSLLKKHYGDHWRQDPKLAFYKIIDQHNPAIVEENEEDEFVQCQDDIDMRI